MKKSYSILVLLLVLIFSVVSSKAQENRYLVGFRYGFSLPMGQFASHEYGYGAYALLGTSFSAESAWYFHKGLGIGANFSVGYYPIATGFFLEDKDKNDPSASNFWMKSGPYKVSTYLVGAFYKIPVFKRFTASFKGMGGLCRSLSPDQFYGAEYFVIGKYFWTKTPSLSSRPVFLVGATLNFELFDHVVILLESEFMYAESKFTFLIDGGTNKEVQFMKMPLFKLQPGLNITF